MVKLILHLGDIHLRTYKRHDEYEYVFNNVYKYLKKEKEINNISEDDNCNIELIVVITGDILHSKSDLSLECIRLTYNFIKKLAMNQDK